MRELTPQKAGIRRRFGHDEAKIFYGLPPDGTVGDSDAAPTDRATCRAYTESQEKADHHPHGQTSPDF
ncbi:hypothetical protein [Streptantibioticus ferralitis]|uniref:Uncharacterized protein n=1 Tax=Streptantibioticus ferralitis TaxID=236510 RepID=A0ABT5Z3R4_9ACTN|nr:hypothetical protein [Streptantibioticus ferralitis]MDF2258339.1 hypothetical protein [Streptantibioticus ferralitis]